jgi:L-threonylcarbamoyladenylate synthase
MMLKTVTELNKDQILRDAVAILNSGGIIAFPTETFYGLGVKFDLETALKKLYEIKKRPLKKAMPLIIGDMFLLDEIAAHINQRERTLMEQYWPGPLTFILHAKEHVSHFITAGNHTVAVRIPGESFALNLARAAAFPITATSANPSGLPPARSADAVLRYFGDQVNLIIDAGPSPGGLPSTIIKVVNDEIKVLRAGAVLPG